MGAGDSSRAGVREYPEFCLMKVFVRHPKLTLLVLMGLVPACLAGEPAALRPVANATNQFTLRGMHCEGCAKGISGELKAMKGVVRVEVSYPKKRARVAYDTNLVETAAMIAVIKEAGYEADLVRSRSARP